MVFSLVIVIVIEINKWSFLFNCRLRGSRSSSGPLRFLVFKHLFLVSVRALVLGVNQNEIENDKLQDGAASCDRTVALSVIVDELGSLLSLDHALVDANGRLF